MPIHRAIVSSLAGLAVLWTGAEAGESARAPFIDAASVVPGLVVEMRYAGSHNFVGRPIPGYEAPICLLTEQAARALRRAQATLSKQGLGLKGFDCYRPEQAVRAFVEWAADPVDIVGKAEFYPTIDKTDLLRLGYIAARSAHSRGSTIDLTLVDLADGAERDMGTPFDYFGPESGQAWPHLTPVQTANRKRLRETMIRAGFRPYPQEWWHFTLAREPFPHTTFDLPIRSAGAEPSR